MKNEYNTFDFEKFDASDVYLKFEHPCKTNHAAVLLETFKGGCSSPFTFYIDRDTGIVDGCVRAFNRRYGYCCNFTVEDHNQFNGWPLYVYKDGERIETWLLYNDPDGNSRLMILGDDEFYDEEEEIVDYGYLFEEHIEKGFFNGKTENEILTFFDLYYTKA